MKSKRKKCKREGCENLLPHYNSIRKYCSPKCKIEDGRWTRIKPVSDKRKEDLEIYYALVPDFLSRERNKICPVTGEPTIEVHHKMGRQGYADLWALDNKISLLIDVRYWLAVSREGHRQIEANPAWAKKEGYSINKLYRL